MLQACIAVFSAPCVDAAEISGKVADIREAPEAEVGERIGVGPFECVVFKKKTDDVASRPLLLEASWVDWRRDRTIIVSGQFPRGGRLDVEQVSTGLVGTLVRIPREFDGTLKVEWMANAGIPVIITPGLYVVSLMGDGVVDRSLLVPTPDIIIGTPPEPVGWYDEEKLTPPPPAPGE